MTLSMNVVLFSASLCNFRPVWFLWPIMLFFLLLILSFIPAIKEKLYFVRSVRGFKVFAIIQCIMLVGHIYAFATQLLPYYMGHYSVVEGNVGEFSAPTSMYNKREAFSVNGVRFEYGYSDISFGYHDTIFDHGIISDTSENIRISYVHNPLTGENVIVCIEQLIKGESVIQVHERSNLPPMCKYFTEL